MLCETPTIKVLGDKAREAVGAFYDDFHQLDDAEVAALLSTS